MEIKIKPTSFIVYQLFSEGKYQEAINIASHYLNQDPDDVELMILLGICLSKVGINDIAYIWLKKALDSIDSNHPFYKTELWQKANECIAEIAFYCKRDYKEAEMYLLVTTENGYSTNNITTNRLLGTIAHAKGQHKASLDMLSLLAQQTSLKQDELFAMAISSLMVDDFEGARRYITDFWVKQKNFKPLKFMLKNLKDDNRARMLKEFIEKEVSITESKKITKALCLYNSEIEEIYQQRDNIWHTTCLFNDLDGLLLYSLIRHLKPINVIEFSPYMGYSTVFIYKALLMNNNAFTFRTFDLSERAEFRELMSLFDIPIGVVTGDALKTVPDYIKRNGLEGKIDFCLVDSDHGYDFAKAYINNIFSLLGKDCIIAIHDMQYCPDSINMSFDFYRPINPNEICETILSIGEAIALREFFTDRKDYVLISSHRLFGGMGQCAPPLPLNKGLIDAIGTENPFLYEGGYWALPPMMIFAIPKHIWDEKGLIFNK